MKKKDIINIMENLNTPSVESNIYSNSFKIRLINSKKSATFGILLMLLPIIFFFGMFFKYNLGIKLPLVWSIAEKLAQVDHIPGLNYLVRFLLLGGPVITILLNLMAITHVLYNKLSRELIFSFKLKWVNILIIVGCFFLLSAFLLVLLVENINHP